MYCSNWADLRGGVSPVFGDMEALRTSAPIYPLVRVVYIQVSCVRLNSFVVMIGQAHDEAKTSLKRATKLFSAGSKQLVAAKAAHAKVVAR